MKKNMGAGDRVIRIAVAVVLIVLIAIGKFGGTLAVVLGIISGVMLITALMGWCPGYVPFKFSTCKRSGGASTPA